jgi:hypothetical protein
LIEINIDNSDAYKNLISSRNMSRNSDTRKFERFPIDFNIEVVAHDRDGEEHREKTVLEDISGEGVKFLTGKAEHYFIGQSLEVSIYLPGTDEVHASMKSKAKVMRIGPCANASSSGQAKPACVAVKLDTPMSFQRYSAL